MGETWEKEGGFRAYRMIQDNSFLFCKSTRCKWLPSRPRVNIVLINDRMSVENVLTLATNRISVHTVLY